MALKMHIGGYAANLYFKHFSLSLPSGV